MDAMTDDPATRPPDDAAETQADGARRAGVGLRGLAKGLVMIGSLVAVGVVAKQLGLADMLDTRWLDRQVVGQGLYGEIVFVALGAALTAVGLPRQLVAFGGGYAFGLWGGTAIALLAQLLGCALAFFYARLLGRSAVRNRFGRRIRRIDDFLRGNPFTMTLLIRFLPVGSNVVTNLAAGVSSVAAAPFLAGSALGYLPQTLIFALLGTGIHLDTAYRTGVSIALFVASSLIGVALYRRVRGAGKVVSDD